MVKNRVFMAVNKKLTDADGKVHSTTVYKEGAEGTGVTLPFPCMFCKDKSTGLATHAFRTRKERNQHANFCPDPMPRG